MKGTFKSKGLTVNFNPTAKLEVEIRTNTWVETSADMFRSWGGNRRVNGKPFNSEVFFLLSNEVATTIETTITA